MLCGVGGVELWRGFPTPLTGQSEKESSLIGSLAVSFTLNIKVKQKSQASLCWQRRGGPSPAGSGPGTLVLPGQGLPSLTPTPRGPSGNPATSAGSIQHQDTGSVWSEREPPLLTQPGHMSPSPPPRQHTAKQTGKCHRQGKNPNTQTPNPFLLPILFSRLKNKIQTIGEQRSRAALGSTRTRGLCTTIR